MVLAMLRYWFAVLYDAIAKSIESIGQSWMGLLYAALVIGIGAGFILYRRGLAVFREHLGQPVLEMLAIAFLVWLPFFFWHLARTPYLMQKDTEERAKKAEIALSEKQGLKLEILQFGIADGPTENDSRIFMVASVTNQGAPSIADSWKLAVHIPGKPDIAITPDYLDPHKPIVLHHASGKIQKINAEDILYNTTMKEPIQTGMKRIGILGFTLQGVPRLSAQQVGAKFYLRCKDVRGNTIEAEHEITDLNEGQPMFFPGMKPPPK